MHVAVLIKGNNKADAEVPILCEIIASTT